MATNKQEVQALKLELEIQKGVNEKFAELLAKKDVQVKSARPRNSRVPSVNMSTNKNTLDNELIVNAVKIGGIMDTAKGKGKMINFNSTKGKKNYRLFVKEAWLDKLVYGKEYTVTEHVSKASGNTSHRIHIGRKASAYGSAKTSSK